MTTRTATQGLRLPEIRFWRELAALALLEMEMSWTVPWFRSLSIATFENPTARVFATLYGMGFAAFITMKLLAGLDLHFKYRRRVLLVLLGISVLVGLQILLYHKEMLSPAALIMQPLYAIANFAALIPNEFVVILAVLYAWRRGAVLAQEHLGPRAVESEFRLGFFVFILYTFVNSFVTGETIPTQMLQGYLFFGLLAMSASRISTLVELRGGVNLEGRGRILGILLAISFAVILASLSGGLMSKDDAALAALVLGLAAVSSLVVSIPVLLIWLYIMFWVVLQFQDILAGMLDSMVGTVQAFLAMIDRLREMLGVLGAQLAEMFWFLGPILRWFGALAPALRILTLLIVIAIAVAMVLMALYIREKRRRNQLGESYEGLDPADLLALLRAALRKRMQLAAEKANALSLAARRRRQAAAKIRRIYASLIELASKRGHPRAEAATPLEHLPVLSKAFPQLGKELKLITTAYNQVRYGELPESRADVDQVSTAWEKIKNSSNATGRRGADEQRRVSRA